MPWSIGWCSKVNTRGPSGLEVIRLLSNETAKTNDDEELSADVKFTVKLIQEENRCPRKRFRDKYNGGCYATSNKAVRNSQSLAIIKYPTKPPKPKLLWTSAFRRKVFASICAVDFSGFCADHREIIKSLRKYKNTKHWPLAYLRML